MSKKILSAGIVMVLIASVFVGVGATTASAQSMNMCQLVDALALAGVIAPDKVDAAKAAAGCTGATTASASYTFTRDLTIGSTGADVTALQNFLISNGNVIAAGATGYFGAQTQSALAAYQAANGITPAAGYFGPITMAKVNYVAPVVVTPTTPSTPSTSLGGGAGDLSVNEKTSGTDDEVMEGEDGAKVLGVEVEADGSDIAIKNVKIELQADSNGSTRINRYVDSVDIMLGSRVVGSADVSDFTKSGTTYSRSIALNNAVVNDGDKDRMYVALNVVNNIDSADLGNTLNVKWVSARYQDGDGVTTTNTSSVDVDVSFTDLASSGDVTLTVSEGTSLDNTTVSVDDTSDTNRVALLDFKLRARGSDITVMSIPFAVVSSGAGITEIANDFRLLMDGEEVGTVTVGASSTATTTTFTFSNLDDDDVIIEDGDTVEFTLEADINDIDGAFTSGDVFTSVTLAGNTITAEDEDGNAVTTGRKGSADTTNLTFQSTGITVTTVSTKNDAQVVNVESDATDNTGSYEIVFDVKAIEDDAFIETGVATRGTTMGDNGVTYRIFDNVTGAATTTGSIVLAEVSRVSGGSLSGDFVKITSGQTARFKLNVTFDPAHATGTISYRAAMYSVNYATTAVNATAQQVLTPEADYRTGYTPIAN